MKVIGLDIGGTKVKAGLFINGKLVNTQSLPVIKSTGREGLFRTIYETINLLGSKDFDHIGVVSAGNIDIEKGVCLLSVNINGWTGAPIKKTLEDKYHVPVYVDNDAIGAVIGELSFLEHPQNVTILTFGTGVGGASLINGKINRDKYSEWGHHELIHDGRPCSCGKKGCAEQYLSATALLKDANKIMAVPNTIILMDRYSKGNKKAIEVIEQYCAWLNAFIDIIYNEVKPDTIILGGGLMNAKEVFAHYLTPHKCVVSFAKASNNAGIIGASLLPNKLG